MKSLLILSLLLCLTAAHADDPALRASMQTKYDAANVGMNAGDFHGFVGLCDAGKFVATNIQKQHQNLSAYIRSLEVKGSSFKTEVQSADTLADMEKAALKIVILRSTVEGGHTISYKTVKMKEDTWRLIGEDWKLVGARLTAITVSRNGKTILDEHEN